MDLKKTGNAYCFDLDSKKYLFNSKTLKIFEVEDSQYEYIKNYGSTTNNVQVKPEYIEDLIKEGFLSNKFEPDYFEEKKKRYELASRAENNYISYLRISLTETCNMRCKYCFVTEEFENKRHSMTREDFESIIDDFISHNKNNNVSVQYFGGEPLLKKDLIELGNSKLKKAVEEGMISSVNQEIVTNGTLIDEKMIKFFHENQIKYTVSLDGLKDINDKNRVFSDGRGSFETVLEKCKLIKKCGGKVVFLMTPSNDNLEKISESIRYMIEELGADEINLNAPQPRQGGWDVDGTMLAREIQRGIEICEKYLIEFNHPAANLIILLKNHELQRYSCMSFCKNQNSNSFGVYIGSDGTVSNCIVKKSSNDFRSFDESRDELVKEKWSFCPSMNEKCQSCPLGNVCVGPCTIEQRLYKDEINTEKCKMMKSMLVWLIGR